jgi:FHA domain
MSGADTPGQRLALIELLDSDGRIARTVDVWQWPVTIGRALDNSLVLADPHAAAHHARIDGDEQGDVTLTVFSSLNGVRDIKAGSQHLAGEPRLRLPAGGTTLQMGATQLRLRLPSEVLVPEQALPLHLQMHTQAQLRALRQETPWLQRVWPALVASVLLAAQLVSHWIGLDPGADHTAWLSMLVGLPVALAAWAGVWALLSKLFQHNFDFMGHLRIALPWLLALVVVEMLWPQLAAAIAQPRLWFLTGPLGVLIAALMVRAHLAHVLPHRQRAVTLGVAAVVGVGSVVSLANTHRSFDALSASPYMATLPMPVLRLAGSSATSELVQAMAPVAVKLARRVKKARDEEEVDSADANVE